ncbi:MAG: PKD domain-containing protein, partial [Bacteroidia bacterium]
SGSGSISSYLWTLGDGNSNFGAGPFTHRYGASGSYTVKLVVTSSFACKDSASRNISIHPEPIASFTVNNKRQCLRGNNVVFTNRSTIATGSLGYNWNFGDGTSSTATNPSKSYSSAGRYAIRLIVVSGNGCRDTITDTVRILAQPSASININNNGQCLDYNRFVFRSTSTVTGDSITGYSWSFGGGFVSGSKSDTIHYRDTGKYAIRLIVTTRSGCRDTANSTVTVYPQGTADFTVASNPQCLRGNSFSFTDNSRVGSGSINGYNWTFGNGGSSTLRNPSGIVYSAAGTYNVRLITRTSNQCLDTQTRTITVKAHPIARTTVNNDTQCLSGNRFTFGSGSSSAAAGSSLASWRWTFGTGASRSSDTNQTPAAVTYSAAGLKPVTFILTDANGCRDTARFNVFVEAMPVAGFSLGSNAQCLRGNSFSPTNTSTGTRSYLWDFGDGTGSSSTSPTKSYASAGNYTIRLIAVSFSGCRDTVTRTVTVHTQPVASFTLNNNAQCLRGNRFTTSNNSTGAGSYNWSFGDGSSSTATSPDKTYTASGTYSIRLRVTTVNGCVDSLTRTVNVYANPTAGFTLNSNTQCVRGNNFTTTNTSSGASTYAWDFGDGFTSSSTSPSRTYAAAGTYNIRLIAITTNACRDTLSRTVTVNAQPVAAFSVNNAAQCLKGNSFVFTNSGSGGSAYSWTFGDGTSSTAGSPSKTYAAAGTYTVRLISISSAGCRDTASRSVTVHPNTAAGFSLNNNAQCLRGNRFTTTNSSSGASTYDWSFGDGTGSSLSNPTKTYASAGTYTIRLIAVSTNGCRDTLTRTVNVYTNPSADFSLNSNTQCIRGNRFTTTNSSTGASSYDWIFGDGTSSTLSNPAKSYTTAGTYNIRLIAITSNGCRDTLTRSVTVNAGPTAGFTLNTSTRCLPNNSFQTTNTSSGATSYAWDFGDGTSSSSSNPSKSYASAGSYTIRLIAIASNGCRDTQRSTVTVHPQPAVGFTLNTNAQCLRGNSFQTTNSSTGATTYEWSFGDGTGHSGTSPSKSYTAAGTYSIRLIAINSNGCRDTLSRSVTVNPNPTAAYTLNNTTQCLRGNSFSTTNSSTGASTYNWDFGDGTSSVSNAPSKTYSAAGTYAIRLIAITASGCRDTLSRTVTVNANASAGFSLNNSTQCLRGNRFAVSNSSTGAASYEWSFGDGTTSTAASPVKTYSASGTYTFRLITLSSAGCRDTLSRSVTVNPNPVAGFSISNSAQCLRGNSFAITNSSTGASTYNWSFGDASTSAVSSPSKTYTAAGTYTIRLVAFNASGCSDTMSRTATVHAQPAAGFTVNNNSQCLRGNNFSFTNSSTGGNTYGWSFGDGTTTSATSPSKTYNSTGTYNVRLIAITLNSCRDTLTRTVTVKAHPVARATVNNDTQCLSGNQFVFRAGSSTPVSGSSITGWRWTYGTGASRSGDTVQSPSAVVYSTSGVRAVSLFVTDANGCRDTGLVSVFAEPNPTASFTLTSSSQCLAGNRFSFTNSSSGATTYSWNFGDGTISSQTTPTKTYSAAGTYTIRLIAISANGCRDTLSRTVTVHPQPAAGFSLNSTAQCLRGNRFTSS